MSPAENPELSWAEQVLRRQAEMLGELAELGMQVARDVVQTEVGDDRRKAFDRVTRAVRLTLMLQAKVVRDVELLDREGLHADPRHTPEYRHKARVERIVERIAKTTHSRDDEAVDRLVIEAGERLDDEDLYPNVLGRPISQLVAAICRDLDLEPDWAKLAEEPWAVAEIKAGAEWPPNTKISSSRTEGSQSPQIRDPVAPP